MDEEIIIYHDESEKKKEPVKKKNSKKKKTKPNRGRITFAIILVFLALFIGIQYKDYLFNWPESIATAELSAEDAAASVNGEDILIGDIDEIFNNLPENLKSSFTKEDLLEQLIIQKLLLQEADAQGITADNTVLDEIIDNIKSEIGSDEDFSKYLSEKGLTLDNLKKKISEQMIISDLLGKTLFTEIMITNTEIENYYNENFNGEPPLEEVSEGISKIILQQKQKASYDVYLKLLKNKATITNNLESQNPLNSFALCLAEQGAVLYGTGWCDIGNKQMELFGTAGKYLKFVECTGEDGTETKACIDNGIDGYPTWKIGEFIYQGFHSLKKLSEISGCEL